MKNFKHFKRNLLVGASLTSLFACTNTEYAIESINDILDKVRVEIIAPLEKQFNSIKESADSLLSQMLVSDSEITVLISQLQVNLNDNEDFFSKQIEDLKASISKNDSTYNEKMAALEALIQANEEGSSLNEDLKNDIDVLFAIAKDLQSYVNGSLEQQLDKLGANDEALFDSITTINTEKLIALAEAINKLESKLDGAMSTQMSQLEIQISQQLGDISGLKNQMITINSTITAIQEQMASSGYDDSELLAQLEAMQSSIETVTGQAQEHQVSMDELDAKIKILEEEMKNFNSTTGSADQDYDERIDSIIGAISTINAEMANLTVTIPEDIIAQLKVVTESLTAVDIDVVDIQVDITNINTTVGKLEASNKELATRIESIDKVIVAVADNTLAIKALQDKIDEMLNDTKDNMGEYNKMVHNVVSAYFNINNKDTEEWAAFEGAVQNVLTEDVGRIEENLNGLTAKVTELETSYNNKIDALKEQLEARLDQLISEFGGVLNQTAFSISYVPVSMDKYIPAKALYYQYAPGVDATDSKIFATTTKFAVKYDIRPAEVAQLIIEDFKVNPENYRILDEVVTRTEESGNDFIIEGIEAVPGKEGQILVSISDVKMFSKINNQEQAYAIALEVKPSAVAKTTMSSYEAINLDYEVESKKVITPVVGYRLNTLADGAVVKGDLEVYSPEKHPFDTQYWLYDHSEGLSLETILENFEPGYLFDSEIYTQKELEGMLHIDLSDQAPEYDAAGNPIVDQSNLQVNEPFVFDATQGLILGESARTMESIGSVASMSGLFYQMGDFQTAPFEIPNIAYIKGKSMDLAAGSVTHIWHFNLAKDYTKDVFTIGTIALETKDDYAAMTKSTKEVVFDAKQVNILNSKGEKVAFDGQFTVSFTPEKTAQLSVAGGLDLFTPGDETYTYELSAIEQGYDIQIEGQFTLDGLPETVTWVGNPKPYVYDPTVDEFKTTYTYAYADPAQEAEVNKHFGSWDIMYMYAVINNDAQETPSAYPTPVLEESTVNLKDMIFSSSILREDITTYDDKFAQDFTFTTVGLAPVQKALPEGYDFTLSTSCEIGIDFTKAITLLDINKKTTLVEDKLIKMLVIGRYYTNKTDSINRVNGILDAESPYAFAPDINVIEDVYFDYKTIEGSTLTWSWETTHTVGDYLSKVTKDNELIFNDKRDILRIVPKILLDGKIDVTAMLMDKYPNYGITARFKNPPITGEIAMRDSFRELVVGESYAGYLTNYIQLTDNRDRAGWVFAENAKDGNIWSSARYADFRDAGDVYNLDIVITDNLPKGITVVKDRITDSEGKIQPRGRIVYDGSDVAPGEYTVTITINNAWYNDVFDMKIIVVEK